MARLLRDLSVVKDFDLQLKKIPKNRELSEGFAGSAETADEAETSDWYLTLFLTTVKMNSPGMEKTPATFP